MRSSISELKITSSRKAFLTSTLGLAPTLNLDSIVNYSFLVTITFIIACLMLDTAELGLSGRQGV